MVTAQIVQFVLIAFNLLCMTCGACFIYLGSKMVSDIKELSSTEHLTLQSVSIVTLCLGCVIFCISFLGCWGAISKKIGHLRGYAIVLFCLFICQVVLAVVVTINYNSFVSELEKFLVTIWDSSHPNLLFHVIEKTFHCCGLNSALDYLPGNLPGSCCGLKFTQICYHDFYLNSCRKTLIHLWMNNQHFVKCGMGGVSAVLLLASVFSSYLAHTLHRNRNNVLYNNH